MTERRTSLRFLGVLSEPCLFSIALNSLFERPIHCRVSLCFVGTVFLGGEDFSTGMGGYNNHWIVNAIKKYVTVFQS